MSRRYADYSRPLAPQSRAISRAFFWIFVGAAILVASTMICGGH